MKNIFLDNKYTKWYISIITNAQNKSRVKLKKNNPEYKYFEGHHIMPRSMNGSNDRENLVLLTPKEHYICHMLLTKMCIGSNYYKMLYAFNRITNKTKGKINSSMYEKLRTEFSTMKSNTNKGKLNNFYGKTHTQETKDHLAKTCPRFGKDNGMFGKQLTQEQKDAISASNKKRTIIPPPAQHGSKNHFSKYYEIINPNGVSSIIRCMKEFCLKNNLCSRTMISFRDKGTIPVQEFTRPYRVKNIETKKNCEGYSIISIEDPSGILPSIDHTVTG